MRGLKRFVFIVMLLMPQVLLWSQTSLSEESALLSGAGFYENYEVRGAFSNKIKAPLFSLLGEDKSIVPQVLSPVSVEFEIRKAERSFYLLFKNEQNYRYPVWGMGNYIIKRSLKKGKFEQVKIFLQNDELSFIRLYPAGSKQTSLQLSLYGKTLYDGVTLPQSLESLTLAPFAYILSLSKNKIPWEDFFTDVNYSEWDTLASLSKDIEEASSGFIEVRDGAMDRTGAFVHIEDESPQKGELKGFNCSGFAKWLVDGLVGEYPLSSIDELKQSAHQSLNFNSWNETYHSRDPYFGLDWTRNLASYYGRAHLGYSKGLENFYDVKSLSFFDYKEGLGYSIEDLKALLYIEAIRNPGRIYLGAVNSPFGKSPTLWQYHHVLLFIPRFTEAGNFVLDVFETNGRSSLHNIEVRYPHSFVNLVYLDGASSFMDPRTLKKNVSNKDF